MVNDERVMLADVGGTHVRFALADVASAQPLLPETICAYGVADFATFTEAARAYLHETGFRVDRGVFAFAGPVDTDEVRMTNHPWTISCARVRTDLGFDSLHFVNDFAAMSLCPILLGTSDTQSIGALGAVRIDASAARTLVVLGPGTGLGVGALVLRGGHVLGLETEGGHVAFAPRNDKEIDILRYLARRFGRVSNERLLCGSGLVNLYGALAEIAGAIAEKCTPEDITRRAASGDALCERSVELFCEILGAFAGDCVLGLGAWDGVYISGGMTPPLLPWLSRGGFRRRFEDKGRFSARLGRVPSVAIVHPYAGLLGAAAFAVIDSGRSPLANAGTRVGETS